HPARRERRARAHLPGLRALQRAQAPERAGEDGHLSPPGARAAGAEVRSRHRPAPGGMVRPLSGPGRRQVAAEIGGMMIHRSIPVLLTLLLGSAAARADDAEIARLLREKGVKVTETKGAVTSVDAGDCSKWTEEDFKQIAQLAHLKMLSFGPGLGDASLPLLSGLPELEYLSTNLSLITDDGMKGFAGFKSLKSLKFFHPCKAFSGAGLAQLAELPNFE